MTQFYRCIIITKIKIPRSSIIFLSFKHVFLTLKLSNLTDIGSNNIKSVIFHYEDKLGYDKMSIYQLFCLVYYINCYNKFSILN